MDWLRRWTGFYLLRPHRYLDPAVLGDDFDLGAWSREEYEHEPDPWLGFQDHVQPVPETLASGTGDCVDYSAVVLSWLWREGTTSEAVMLVCRAGTTGHLAIAADGTTYSSGSIVEERAETYYERTVYTPVFHRRVDLTVAPK